MSFDRPLAIRRSPRARADLVEIWLYIAERNPAAADRVLDAIEHSLPRDWTQSLMGRERPEVAAGIRSFVVMSWTVFYRVEDDSADIVRIVHGARDIDALEF
jgi:toxin ParE1/3/4